MDIFFVFLILYIIIGVIWGLVLGPLSCTAATGREPKISLVCSLVCGIILTATLVITGIFTTGSLVFFLINVGFSGIDSSVTSMQVEICPCYPIPQANFDMSFWLHNPSDSYPLRYDDVHVLISYGGDPSTATVIARAPLQTVDLDKGASFFGETRVVVELDLEVAMAIIKEKQTVGAGSVGIFVTMSAQVETQPLKPLSNRVWKHFATRDVKIDSLLVKTEDDILFRFLK